MEGSPIASDVGKGSRGPGSSQTQEVTTDTVGLTTSTLLALLNSHLSPKKDLLSLVSRPPLGLIEKSCFD